MKMNKKLALSIFYIIAGAVLLSLSVAEVLDSSVFAGMGGAIIAIGVLQTVKNLRYLKDPGYRERVDTDAHDERNIYLSMRSWAWTGYIVVLVEGIGVIVTTILGKEEIRLTLSYSVCLIVLIYWIAYMVLKRKN